MHSTRAIILACDLIALTTFTVIGRRSHDEAAGIEALFAVLSTAAPFFAGWLVATAALGSFIGRVDLWSVVSSTLSTWLVAFPIAVVVRAAMVGRFSPPSFYVVTFFTALALLLIGRILLVTLARGRLQAASRLP